MSQTEMGRLFACTANRFHSASAGVRPNLYPAFRSGIPITYCGSVGGNSDQRAPVGPLRAP